MTDRANTYMTSEEASVLLDRLLELYPATDLSAPLRAKYVERLCKFEFIDMAYAVENDIVENCRRFPSIAELFEYCDRPVKSRRLTEDQLHWSGHNPDDFPEWFLPISEVQKRRAAQKASPKVNEAPGGDITNTMNQDDRIV